MDNKTINRLKEINRPITIKSDVETYEVKINQDFKNLEIQQDVSEKAIEELQRKNYVLKEKICSLENAVKIDKDNISKAFKNIEMLMGVISRKEEGRNYYFLHQMNDLYEDEYYFCFFDFTIQDIRKILIPNYFYANLIKVKEKKDYFIVKAKHFKKLVIYKRFDKETL